MTVAICIVMQVNYSAFHKSRARARQQRGVVGVGVGGGFCTYTVLYFGDYQKFADRAQLPLRLARTTVNTRRVRACPKFISINAAYASRPYSLDRGSGTRNRLRLRPFGNFGKVLIQRTRENGNRDRVSARIRGNFAPSFVKVRDFVPGVFLRVDC